MKCVALWLLVLTGSAGAEPAVVKWQVTSTMDASVNRLVVLAGGDVIAAGGLKGKATIGRHILESHDDAIWLARFDASGAVVWATRIPTDKYRSDYLGGLAVAKDGTLLVDALRLGEETPKLRRFVVKTDGTVVQPPTVLIAEQRTMASSILPSGDSLVALDASRSPKPDPCKGSRLERRKLDAKAPAWSICNDKVDTGALNLIALASDGRSASCAYGWIAAFSAAGKRAWQTVHPQELWCEHLALSERGDVIATYDGPPTQTVVSRNSNGAVSWTTRCTDLLSRAGRCFFSHLALDRDQRRDDVVVAGRTQDQDAIVVLDGKTGRASKTYAMKQFVSTFALAETFIAFASNTPSSTTIGVIAR